MTSRVGHVAIGRNEGERLVACLDSLAKAGGPIVYVDSGSTDESVEAARRVGAHVVELDMSTPFTAARARNEGAAALAKIAPDADFIQFIDGDCELAPEWPATGMAALSEDDARALVVGRVREKARSATIYNRLCDLEWEGPIGEIPACGGIFLIRRQAFDAVGGFNPTVIAAEDDEFCVRLRGAGYRLWRLPAPMCDHDAAMTRFSQWWRRAVRAGHAFSDVGARHPGYFLGERRRSLLWGGAIPAAALLAAPISGGLSLAAFGLYPLSVIRLSVRFLREGKPPADAALYAFFLTLAKFPNALGMLSYWSDRLRGRRAQIIEYK